MAPVQGNDDTSPKPFGENDDRCVNSAEGKIAVLID